MILGKIWILRTFKSRKESSYVASRLLVPQLLFPEPETIIAFASLLSLCISKNDIIFFLCGLNLIYG